LRDFWVNVYQSDGRTFYGYPTQQVPKLVIPCNGGPKLVGRWHVKLRRDWTFKKVHWWYDQE
jgi:hypothetical protein